MCEQTKHGNKTSTVLSSSTSLSLLYKETSVCSGPERSHFNRTHVSSPTDPHRETRPVWDELLAPKLFTSCPHPKNQREVCSWPLINATLVEKSRGWIRVYLFYLYLTSQLKEQIIISNDCLGTVGKLPCSGAERQICTLSAWGFELATFRLLVQRSNH